jgi:hypothetical protein
MEKLGTYREEIKDLDAWVLCNRIEDDLEEVVARYKGLVKQESFSNIAWDMWKRVCDEEGDAYKHYPSMGNEVKF